MGDRQDCIEIGPWASYLPVAVLGRGVASAMESIRSWEYKVVKLGPSSSSQGEALLNELGAAGWDLVVFQPTSERAYPGEGTYVLKRPAVGGTERRP